jgi:hypothetical protein
MQALLQSHFPNCLQSGTSVSESGLTISIKPSKDETIQFYCTDCDHARKKLCMVREERTSCDYVVLYARNMQSNEKELLCFLELKGSDIKHAAEQIRNTCKYVHTFWKDKLERKQHEYVVQCACICLHGRGSYLRDQIRARQLLRPIFSNEDYVEVKRVNDKYKELGQFLRKLYDK